MELLLGITLFAAAGYAGYQAGLQNSPNPRGHDHIPRRWRRGRR